MYIEQFSLNSVAQIRKKIDDSSIPKCCKTKQLSSVDNSTIELRFYRIPHSMGVSHLWSQLALCFGREMIVLEPGPRRMINKQRGPEIDGPIYIRCNCRGTRLIRAFLPQLIISTLFSFVVCQNQGMNLWRNIYILSFVTLRLGDLMTYLGRFFVTVLFKLMSILMWSRLSRKSLAKIGMYVTPSQDRIAMKS